MWIFVGIYAVLVISVLALNRGKKVPEKYNSLYKKVVMILLIANTLGILVQVSDEQRKSLPDGNRIKRSKIGETEKIEILDMKVDGTEKTVELPVSPREYSEKEIEALFRQAMDRLDTTIAGENRTLDKVQENLYLPEELEGFPITITWELSRYDVLDSTGKVYQDVLCQMAEAKEGIPVKLTGFLKYQKHEAMYEAEARVYPQEETEKPLTERILAEAKTVEGETKEEEYVFLPTIVEGHRVSWQRNVENRSVMVLSLGIFGGVLFVMNEKQKLKKKEQERKVQMLLDYPEVIEEFTMLMEAGMTAKNTWKKITEKYKERRERTGERAAYEEMLYTWNEMAGGITEAESYERFGRRCGLAPYMKFGALLSQNLRKGTKGIAEILNMEAIQAFEERKSRAKRLGEEAGTKLLIPMFLMLVIVLMIVIIPAFLSVQI